jgi:hypothetical protein
MMDEVGMRVGDWVEFLPVAQGKIIIRQVPPEEVAIAKEREKVRKYKKRGKGYGRRGRPKKGEMPPGQEA